MSEARTASSATTSIAGAPSFWGLWTSPPSYSTTRPANSSKTASFPVANKRFVAAMGSNFGRLSLGSWLTNEPSARMTSWGLLFSKVKVRRPELRSVGTSRSRTASSSFEICASLPLTIKLLVRASGLKVIPGICSSSTLTCLPLASTTYFSTRTANKERSGPMIASAPTCSSLMMRTMPSVSWASKEATIPARRRTWAAVSTITKAFCWGSAETEPYPATKPRSCSTNALADAIRSGSTKVTTSSSVTVSGKEPTKVGTSRLAISAKGWRYSMSSRRRSMTPLACKMVLSTCKPSSMPYVRSLW